MLQRLAAKLPLKRGEGVVTSLMFFYIFGVMTLYYILKPLRSALFLTNYPAGDLSYAYLLTALFAGSLSALIFRLTRRLSAIRMMTGLNLGIIATLLLFRWAIGRPIAWLPYAYFIYVQMVPGLSAAMFWLLAGYVYDSRQSRRIFPLLGFGAIFGAMTGSVIPGFLSGRLSAQSMMSICALICILLIFCSRLVWRRRRPDTERTAVRSSGEKEASTGDIFRTVFGSRHLSLMVLSVFLAIIASQLAEWQLNAAAAGAFQDLPKAEQSREIGRLFAQVNFATNVLGALVQLALTGLVVRSLGIGAAILFLPAGLLLSSLGVLASPGLATTIVVLGINNIFEHSLYRVGRELLYLPLSMDARKKVKVFIDVFADKCGRGAAGLIILAIASSLPGLLALRSTAAAVILLSALGIMLSLWLRSSYQDVLRELLARRELDLAGIARFVEDPGAVRALISALEGPGERQILYALSLLQSMRGIDFSRRLLPLLEHPSPFVREEAARTLSALPGVHFRKAEELLRDPSDRVRAAAIEYICSTGSDEPSRRVDALLQKGDTGIRIAAARWLVENPRVQYIPSGNLVEELRRGSGPDPEGARIAAALLGGRLPATEATPFLRGFLDAPETEVVQAAARAAASGGHTNLVCDLARLLRSRKHRAAAREALLAYGPRIVWALGDLLADQAGESQTRREIPWILGRIVTVPSCEVLLSRLHDSDRHVRYRSVKALNRIREQNPELPPPGPEILARIFAETRESYAAFVTSQSLRESAGRQGATLLLKSLRERMEQNQELIFRLLGLQYPMKDIYSVYSALRGARPARRTAAIEFLDSLLRQDLRAVLLPLLEESSPERLVELAARSFGLRKGGREEALRNLLSQDDEWILACALHEVGSTRERGLEALCRGFADDSRPLVREVAGWALRQVAS